MYFQLALTSCRTARLCSVPRFAGTGADRLVRRARRCGALAIGRLRSRKHGKTVAPAEATLAMRHAVFSATLSIVGRAQSVLEASVCGRKKAIGTTARFFFAFDADNSSSADDLFCSGGAQDATSLRRCSPPSLERCRGGRITDGSPYDGAVGYNGCGDAYAGAASSASFLNRCDEHCTLHAGPYCSVCASGYFRKGKICAVCDDSTKNIM